MTETELKLQLASIDKALAEGMRAREEAMKFAAEARRIEQLRAGEQAKINAETSKLRYEVLVEPWRMALGGLATGVALVLGIAGILKLLMG